MLEKRFLQKISLLQASLSCHPLYASIRTIDDLKIFMSHHVFAVWDFMSLLKTLQKEITCCDIPWRPSPYSKELVRFINEIVIGEESDVLPNGMYSDHFSLYLNSMEEIKADLVPINSFLEHFDKSSLKKSIKDFVSYTLDLVQNGEIYEVAASFLYGREDLIPKMFRGLLEGMKVDPLRCKSLIYYIERHIEVDGDEHGLLAENCLKSLCGDDPLKWEKAYLSGVKSLEQRKSLWDSIYSELKVRLVIDPQI